MSEDKKRKRKTDKAKHHLWHLWAALFVVFVGATVCCFIWQRHLWNAGSIDERLAAIDAELAIPDFENAAVFYRRFFTDPNNAAILDDLSSLTPSAYVEPWAGSEHPELAAELKKNRAFMQTLLDISGMEEARFPIYPNPSSSSFTLADMRKITFILSWAAANDLAEGRAEEAHNKYRCQFNLARLLQQQPAAYYRLVSIAIEAVASGNIKRAAMRDEITTEQLSSLEMILKIPLERDEVVAEVADRVNLLIEEKEMSALPLIARFKYWLHGRATPTSRLQREKMQHLRLQASQQATRILIALRRHKEKTGTWPQSLEQIEPKLPEKMLIDPQNNSSFVYKRDGDSFVFYSKGSNGIDEGGSYSGSADDWPIWPLKIKKSPAGK